MGVFEYIKSYEKTLLKAYNGLTGTHDNRQPHNILGWDNYNHDISVINKFLKEYGKN